LEIIVIEYLYHFENEQFSLTEIKISVMPYDSPKSWIYHWLMLDKVRRQIMRLDFESMSNNGDDQFRQFKQGKLQFNSLAAQFETHQLKSKQEIAPEIQSLYLQYAQSFLASLPLLLTQRTYSRLATIADIPGIIAFHQRNDVQHFAPWNPLLPENFYHPEFWLTKVERSLVEFETDETLRLFTFLKSNNQLIATISFTNFVRGPFQNCSLGYKIDQQFQGQGLMFEALEKCIQYVFEQLKFHRIEANYIPYNTRSGRLLERLNFEKNGLAKKYLKINGQWQDHVLTSLLNPDVSYL
jgi:ribosomal-protein-alanine N-acetyltransferase